MLDFPTIVDISNKGQITIPAKLRKALGVGPRGKVYLSMNEKKKILRVTPAKKDLIEELCGVLLPYTKGESITKELVEQRRKDLEQEEREIMSDSKKRV